MDEDGYEKRLAELNRQLTILAFIFPRVRPEVFREMLHTFDGDSGLHIVVEQLLKHQDQWVRGRWRADISEGRPKQSQFLECTAPIIKAEDEFRRASYKSTVRKTLFDEFRVLSRSKIEAVLAEENFCYSHARPTLRKLASKTWRNTLSTFMSKWRKPSESTPRDHDMIVWPTTKGEIVRTAPTLRETGDAELDAELRQQVLSPLLEKMKTDQEAQDWHTAVTINEAEAKQAGAMYECECCYSDSVWEQLATCTTSGHVICFDCIWRAVSEALFGQSWGLNIDHVRGQVKCLAPVSEESCEGCIPQDLAHRAILLAKGGKEAWIKLESRLAEEAMSKCCLSLVRCPFCTYAEVDELYLPVSTARHKLNTRHLRTTFLLSMAMLNFVPLLLLYSLLSHLAPFQALPRLSDMFSKSLTCLSRANHLSRRFQCLSPSCGLPSCLSCLKTWHDPHICHESASLSLRTTVEAARTAALKRTCPRCGLGFIKDSGCNKLTCVCGYSMCYICRQGLGRGIGEEGYRHFCQHFRPTGDACMECDKCDLYKNENDEALVRKAGTLAEKEWREKEGMIGVEGLKGGQDATANRAWWYGDWTMQGLLDWWVGQVLTC